ncbi:MAG: HypC/HybG/HupF family hydrogenase formation chaperone [Elusimicrobiota bacterium]|jgi:hydrogenase expression/formation protein HypC|nr:HypC/HybG/HupF family hydrogenase formation chaperone [Elusimicrobiota bacterium]
MCLSVIGKIIKVSADSALVDLDGVKKEVSITLKPKAKKGDYVLLHAGFAIEIMQSKEAKKVLKDIKETKIL